MTLFEVDVHGVSKRYVEADTREEAKQVVLQALMGALDLRVSKASRTVAAIYEDLGPIQRRRYLDGLDGMTSESGLAAARRARRRLALQVRYDMERRAWVKDLTKDAEPPADPERLRRLMEITELRRKRAYLNLQDELARTPPSTSTAL